MRNKLLAVLLVAMTIAIGWAVGWCFVVTWSRFHPISPLQLRRPPCGLDNLSGAQGCLLARSLRNTSHVE